MDCSTAQPAKAAWSVGQHDKSHAQLQPPSALGFSHCSNWVSGQVGEGNQIPIHKRFPRVIRCVYVALSASQTDDEIVDAVMIPAEPGSAAASDEQEEEEGSRRRSTSLVVHRLSRRWTPCSATCWVYCQSQWQSPDEPAVRRTVHPKNDALRNWL